MDASFSAQRHGRSYEAIRIIAERSLKSIKGEEEEFGYDFLDLPAKRTETIRSQLGSFHAQDRVSKDGNAHLLLDENGDLDWARFEDLLKRRNNRLVELFV